MKRSTLILGLLSGICLSAIAMQAEAANSKVENALRKHPEVSMFYEQLQRTGVLAELNERGKYTIFAPTNAAFAKITPEQYPCFYAAPCKEDAAALLRTHIVSGEYSVRDAVEHNKSVFSLDKHPIVIGEQGTDKYTAGGHNVVKEHQLKGSIFYEIDGVLASDQDLMAFAAPKVVPVAVVAAPPVPAKPEVSTTRKIIYSADGTPERISETTTIKGDPTGIAPAAR